MLKTSRSKSTIIIAIAVIAFGIGITSCAGDSGKEDIFDAVSSSVTDSIRKGSVAGARSYLDRGLAAAQDSDTYYAYLSQKAVVEYYGARPDSILAASDATLRYLSGVEATPLRLKIKSKAEQAKAGYWNQYNYNADSLLHYQKAGYDDASRSGDKLMTQLALTNLADSYRVAGQLDKAALHYRHAAAMADSLALDNYGLIPVYSGLAATYTALHQFQQSDVWWRKVEGLYKEMPPAEKFYFLNNRGNDLYLARKYKESLSYFKRLEQMLAGHPEMEWEQHFCSANICDVMIKLGRGREVADLIERNLHYFLKVQPNPYAYDHILLQKMSLLKEEGRNSEVIELLRLHPVDQAVRHEQYLERYQFLTDFYPVVGDWKRAFNALSNYDAIEDSIRNERVRLSASEQELRYRHDSEVLSLRIDLDQHRTHLLQTYVVIAGIALVAVILAMVFIISRRNTRLREQRMLNKIMRLKIESARSGLTPHFIYNALNQELYAREQGLPGNLTTLSSLMRRQQRFAAELTATLEDELSFADDYIKVERLNVKGDLIYERIVDESMDLRSCCLPAMTIQILVENAFKHGLLPLDGEGTALLRICVERGEGVTRVTVANTTPARIDPNPNSTKIGLKIIMATMQLLNEHNRQKMRLSVSEWRDAPGGHGYKAEITVPDNYNFEITTPDE